MKRTFISIIAGICFGLLGGCCSDMGCGAMGTTYISTNACTGCARTCTSCSTCSTCGYDASYTYSGWY